MAERSKGRKGKKGPVNFKSADFSYWKGLYFSTEARRREAWRKYYEEVEQNFRALLFSRRLVARPEIAAHIPTHIKTEYLEMIAKADESKRECSICTLPITVEAARLTDCGHLFHEACVSTLTNCAICRTPMKALASASSSASAAPTPTPGSEPTSSAPGST